MIAIVEYLMSHIFPVSNFISVSRCTQGAVYSSFARGVTYVWKHTFAKIGEDWVFLCVLGILMACISMVMDWGIELCSHSRLWLYQ